MAAANTGWTTERPTFIRNVPPIRTGSAFFTSEGYDRFTYTCLYDDGADFEAFLRRKTEELRNPGAAERKGENDRSGQKAEGAGSLEQRFPVSSGHAHLGDGGQPLVSTQQVPVPRKSWLMSGEQRRYLELYNRYHNCPPQHPTEGERIEMNILRELQTKVTAEQEEFQSYLKQVAECNVSTYNFMKPAARKYMEDKLNQMCKRVRQYPRYYETIDALSLTIPLEQKEFPPLAYVRPLLELGQVDKVILPSLMCGVKPALPTDFTQVAERYPPAGRKTTGTKCWNKQACSQDWNAEVLAQKYGCKVVLSSGGLKCLLDNQSPGFHHTWQLPIVVKEYPVTENGTKFMHKVIYIDKPFVKQKMTVREKNCKFYKAALKTLVCNVLKSHKLGSKRTEVISDIQPIGNVQRQKGKGKPAGQKTDIKSKVSVSKVSEDFFGSGDVEMQDLETFGMSAELTRKSGSATLKNAIDGTGTSNLLSRSHSRKLSSTATVLVNEDESYNPAPDFVIDPPLMKSEKIDLLTENTANPDSSGSKIAGSTDSVGHETSQTEDIYGGQMDQTEEHPRDLQGTGSCIKTENLGTANIGSEEQEITHRGTSNIAVTNTNMETANIESRGLSTGIKVEEASVTSETLVITKDVIGQSSEGKGQMEGQTVPIKQEPGGQSSNCEGQAKDVTTLQKPEQKSTDTCISSDHSDKKKVEVHDEQTSVHVEQTSVLNSAGKDTVCIDPPLDGSDVEIIVVKRRRGRPRKLANRPKSASESKPGDHVPSSTGRAADLPMKSLQVKDTQQDPSVVMMSPEVAKVATAGRTGLRRSPRSLGQSPRLGTPLTGGKTVPTSVSRPGHGAASGKLRPDDSLCVETSDEDRLVIVSPVRGSVKGSSPIQAPGGKTHTDGRETTGRLASSDEDSQLVIDLPEPMEPVKPATRRRSQRISGMKTETTDAESDTGETKPPAKRGRKAKSKTCAEKSLPTESSDEGSMRRRSGRLAARESPSVKTEPTGDVMKPKRERRCPRKKRKDESEGVVSLETVPRPEDVDTQPGALTARVEGRTESGVGVNIPPVKAVGNDTQTDRDSENRTRNLSEIDEIQEPSDLSEADLEPSLPVIIPLSPVYNNNNTVVMDTASGSAEPELVIQPFILKPSHVPPAPSDVDPGRRNVLSSREPGFKSPKARTRRAQSKQYEDPLGTILKLQDNMLHHPTTTLGHLPCPARQSTALPHQSQAPPHQSPAPPRQSPAPPRKSPAPPRQSQALPDQSPAPPQQSQAPPHLSPVPPNQSPAPPHQSQAPPHHPQAQPHHPQAPPHHPQAPPHHPQAPPHHPQAPPHHPQAPPHQSPGPPHHPQAPPHHPQAPPHHPQAPPQSAPARPPAVSMPTGRENPLDYEQPLEPLNTTYHLWSFGGRPVLIRSAYHGFRRDSNQRVSYVALSTKLEYQTNHGLEQRTGSEMIREWIGCYIRQNCPLLRARVNAVSSELVMLEEVDASRIVPPSHSHLPPQALQRLNKVFSKFDTLAVGNYLLSHNGGDNHCKLRKAVEGNKRGAYDLHFAYTGFSCGDTNLPTGPDWIPIDPAVVLPFHWKNNRIPATFDPPDFTAAVSHVGKKTPYQACRQKKGKPKKNRGKKKANKSKE